MKEQDQEVELSKKILKNNEVLIETNKKLNAALIGFETKIQELEKMNEILKSNQEKEKQIVQQNEKRIKVGFQSYF